MYEKHRSVFFAVDRTSAATTQAKTTPGMNPAMRSRHKAVIPPRCPSNLRFLFHRLTRERECPKKAGAAMASFPSTRVAAVGSARGHPWAIAIRREARLETRGLADRPSSHEAPWTTQKFEESPGYRSTLQVLRRDWKNRHYKRYSITQTPPPLSSPEDRFPRQT